MESSQNPRNFACVNLMSDQKLVSEGAGRINPCTHIYTLLLLRVCVSSAVQRGPLYKEGSLRQPDLSTVASCFPIISKDHLYVASYLLLEVDPARDS